MACWLVPASALHGKRVYWISEKKKEEEEGRAKKSLDGKKIGAFITRGGSLFPGARRAPRADFWWLAARKLSLLG